METSEIDTEFDAAVRWVLAHPGRQKAFPGWSDEQISAAYRICKSEHAALFFYADQKQPVGTALVGLYPEISTCYVIGILGDRLTLGRALATWAKRRPTWKVVASRRDGKRHSYSVTQLCRLLRLSKR
jgi:hypothetical protein